MKMAMVLLGALAVVLLANCGLSGGSACTSNDQCASGTCVTRGGPDAGYCCEQRFGCP